MKENISKQIPCLLRKYKIVWDNDDVLVPSGTGLIEHFNKHLNKNIQGGHYTQFQKLYEIDAVEETRLLDLFANENIAGSLKPIREMDNLLLLLHKAKCTNYICTARPLVTYGQATKQWLHEYFNKSVDLKNLSMFEGSNEQHYAFDKFPFFESVRGDIFVDDSFHNVKSIAEQCSRDILVMFQETPHNKHVTESMLPKNVISIPHQNQAYHILKTILKYDEKQRNNTKTYDVEARTFTD